MSDMLPSTSSCLLLTPVDTSLNDDNTTVVNTFNPKNVGQVKRNILITPKSICPSIFHDVVPYPETKVIDSKIKRKKEYSPSVITSDIGVQYHEENESMKKETEQNKLERKQARELNKLKKEQEKAEKLKGKGQTKKLKKQISESSSSSEEIVKEWEESGSSGDDVELTDSPEEIEMLKADDLKLGTFVLVKFEMLGKRNASTYRCINTEKTAFYKIENDISTIIESDILGKLPDPIIEKDRRKTKMVFPGRVDIFEKIL